MTVSALTAEAIGRRGEALYDERIRDIVEADADNRGKIIVLDIETGDYEIDTTGLDAADRLRSRRPQGELYALRIGYDAVYTLRSKLSPSKR